MFFPFHDDNATERTPVVTVALIVINVISFVAIQRLSVPDRQLLAYTHGFVPARIAQLGNHKPIVIPFQRQRVLHPVFGPIELRKNLRLEPAPPQILATLVTCMFLHGGWLHLIGNMWFLWVFGNNVEDHLGPVPFLGVYLLGGLLASGCHWLTGPNSITPVIGASGAVATVLGAYAITWPWARIHTLVFLFVFITVIDLPALLVLGVWFLGQLLEGTRALNLGITGGVAWWAHVGGFVAGMLLMPFVSAAVGAGRRQKSARETVDDAW